MNNTKNGIETSMYTVALTNEPGALEQLLFTLKSVNIIGFKLINSGEFGAAQFVVEPEFVKPVNTVLSRGHFTYTTTIVYGVYLPNTPSALYNHIVRPLSKLGVNITNLFTGVGSPRVFVSFDPSSKALPVLRSIPSPLQPVNARQLVTA